MTLEEQHQEWRSQAELDQAIKINEAERIYLEAKIKHHKHPTAINEAAMQIAFDLLESTKSLGLKELEAIEAQIQSMNWTKEESDRPSP